MERSDEIGFGSVTVGSLHDACIRLYEVLSCLNLMNVVCMHLSLFEGSKQVNFAVLAAMFLFRKRFLGHSYHERSDTIKRSQKNTLLVGMTLSNAPNLSTL